MSDYEQRYNEWREALHLAQDRGYRDVDGSRFASDHVACPRCGSLVQLLAVPVHEKFHRKIKKLEKWLANVASRPAFDFRYLDDR